jgi:hypothetical protein
MFIITVTGLAGFWVVAIGYELYLRLTIKCIDCIVEDPGRLRFFKRLSMTIAILCIGTTVAFWLMDSYMVFVLFILSLYFVRLFILARSRYSGLMEELEEDENDEYNPNISLGEDLKQTMSQLKLLLTSPKKFFNQ